MREEEEEEVEDEGRDFKRMQRIPKMDKDSIRGAGTWVNNVDTVLGLTKKDDGTRLLEPFKQKDGEWFRGIKLQLEQVETGRRFIQN